jgi:hypothetical protein
MGYPNIQHSHPSCALWLFCALRSQISHDVTQIKHNSGFFGLELSISCLNSYHSSRASARRSCLCVAVPFLLADLAFFFFLFLPLRPPWDLAFMMPQRLSIDLAFMMPQRLPVDLAFMMPQRLPVDLALIMPQRLSEDLAFMFDSIASVIHAFCWFSFSLSILVRFHCAPAAAAPCRV